MDITKDGITVQKDGASIQSGNDLKWPKSSMGDLSEPKGKIIGILNGNTTGGGTVVLSEMSLDDAKAYVEKLKDLGYKEISSFSDASSLLYGGKNIGGATVVMTYNGTSKEGTIQYILVDANKVN